MLVSVCLFFFSSRRRHTRCSRDWSSDVCSSDLIHDSSRGEVSASQGFVDGQRFRIVNRRTLEQRDCLFCALQSEQRVTCQIIQLGRRRLLSEEVFKQLQSCTVVMAKL